RGGARIAGPWRISGCAAPTRRATRHLRLYAFNGSVGPARSLSATGGLPAAARGRDVCGVTLAGAASHLTSRHLMRVPLSGRDAPTIDLLHQQSRSIYPM